MPPQNADKASPDDTNIEPVRVFSGRVAALAGGVGAARMLRGLVRATDPAKLTTIVNTGDDREFYGVYVAPDLDIVTYTLAGAVDPGKGFGLAGDTFSLMEELGTLGHETWFRLGDRDFAHCLHRTLRMRAGDGLAQLSESLRRTHGLSCSILPMSEDPAPTLVELNDGRSLHFEEYLVREKSPANVRAVHLDAARAATPAPGVLAAIATAEIVIICPSNPVVSIGPILAVPGIREAIVNSGAPVVAISPIIGGAPVKGPADHLLRAIGCEVSALGVAGLYRDLAQGFVFDRVDAAQLADIEELGMRAVSTQTLMTDLDISTQLAATALELALSLR